MIIDTAFPFCIRGSLGGGRKVDGGFLIANFAGQNVNPNPMETGLIGFFSKPLVRKSIFTSKNEILI